MLRCIALSTMILDHTGAMLFPSVLWMRAVGRIAFPLYCFLLAQGFRHTRSVPKYALRLYLFALLSEIPYNLLFHSAFVQPAANNVFFSLFLGLCAMIVWKRYLSQRPLWALLGVVLICILAKVIHCDYGFYGVLLSLCFYLAGDNKVDQSLALVICAGINLGSLFVLNTFRAEYWRWMQLYALIALLPILLYNGKPGYRKGKLAFYALYPAHLLLLWLIVMYR